MKVSYPSSWNRTDFEKGISFDVVPGKQVGSFSIIAEKLSPFGAQTAREYLENKVNVMRYFPDFRLLEANSNVTLGALPAEKATFTTSFSTTDRGSDTTLTQTLIVAMTDDRQLYQVLYGGVSSDYTTFLPTYEKMVETVEITG
jgi:hypothetical protein